jgi:hypothetical protein
MIIELIRPAIIKQYVAGRIYNGYPQILLRDVVHETYYGLVDVRTLLAFAE